MNRPRPESPCTRPNQRRTARRKAESSKIRSGGTGPADRLQGIRSRAEDQRGWVKGAYAEARVPETTKEWSSGPQGPRVPLPGDARELPAKPGRGGQRQESVHRGISEETR